MCIECMAFVSASSVIQVLAALRVYIEDSVTATQLHACRNEALLSPSLCLSTAGLRLVSKHRSSHDRNAWQFCHLLPNQLIISF